MQPDDVTLGEVSRNLGRLESSMFVLTQTLSDLRAEITREIEARIADKMIAANMRIDRLERLVYGAIGTVLVAFMMSLWQVVDQGG
jgi:hypothetical protein